MMGLQSTGHALVRSALHKAGSRQICVCKARSTDTLALLGCYAFQDVHLVIRRGFTALDCLCQLVVVNS